MRRWFLGFLCLYLPLAVSAEWEIYQGRLMANDTAIHPQFGEVQVLTIDDTTLGPVAVCMGIGFPGVGWCADHLQLGRMYLATVEMNTEILPGETVPILLDIEEVTAVFSDGFELGNASAWSVVVAEL